MCHTRAPVKVYRVGIADREGNWIEPHTFAPSGEGEALPQEVVQEAIQRKETRIREVIRDAERALVIMATPSLTETGDIAGVLALEFDPFLTISALISSPGSTEEGYYFEVINETGRVLATGGPGAKDSPRRAGEESVYSRLIAPLMQENRAGTVKEEDEKRIIAFAPVSLGERSWGVTVERAEDTALMLPGALQRKMLLFDGIAFIIILILAWLSTRRVVKPIRSLTAASQRIARGNLEQPITLKGRDEVGLLARAFDEMRTKLRNSQQELEAWNRMLEQRVQRRTRELAALFDASQALTSTLELNTVLETIMTKTRDIFPLADAGVLFLYDRERDVLIVGSSFGFSQDISSRLTLKPGEDDAGETFLWGKASLRRRTKLSSKLRDNLFPPGQGGDRVKEAICVPLVYQERTIGSFILYNLNHRESFTPSDVQLLQALANQGAIAIENARLFKEASLVGTLRELDRMKTEFIARASHELRTPLTSIKSLAETLLRDDLTLPPSQQREFLEGINNASDRLGRIISDLLTVSRIEAGKMEVKKIPIPLPALINKVVAEMQLQAGDRAFSLSLSEELPPAWADPDRLEDVLHNLLSNAIKYSPPDKPITIKARPWEKGDSPGSAIVISISDQGEGIPAHEMGKLFRRFSRVESPASRAVGGVGLGLYICKAYVEAMGGEIWAESVVGKGSTFSFTLPAAELKDELHPVPYPPDKEVSPAGEDSILKGKRILVIDDDPDVLRIAQLNLNSQGADTRVARSGEEGLAAIKEEKPDIILLDIVLPDIDGLELARRLRQHPGTRSIPIIFISAKAQEEDIARGQQLGAAGYIKKPFSLAQLKEIVGAALCSGGKAARKRSSRQRSNPGTQATLF
jgi:signal transduction histidine kinase/CheY-like chemotaxis protein